MKKVIFWFSVLFTTAALLGIWLGMLIEQNTILTEVD